MGDSIAETKEHVVNVFDEVAATRSWELLYAKNLDADDVDKTSYNFLSRRRAVAELLKPYLGGSVIDIGCGSGDLVPILIGQIDRYTGVDLSPKMIERANSNFGTQGNVAFEVADSEAIAYEDGSFDLTVAVALIEYFPDPTKTFREIGRLTKSGGYAVVTVPYCKSIDRYIRAVLKPVIYVSYPLFTLLRHRPLRAMRTVKHQAYSDTDLDQSMDKEGFDKVDHRYTNFHCVPFPIDILFPRTYVRASERVDRNGLGDRYKWFASNYLALYRKR